MVISKNQRSHIKGVALTRSKAVLNRATGKLAFYTGQLDTHGSRKTPKAFDSTIGVRGAVSVSVFLAPFFGLALGCSDSYSSSLASGHFYGGLRDGGYGICVSI